MLIDTHAHLFPDKLAEKTIRHLAKISNCTPYSDATVSDTLAKMDAWGVDYSVILHIATRAEQQQNVNNFAKQVQDGNERLLCFGSVFPNASESAIEELHRIKELGLYGVKLHPDYQDFFVREERYFPLYETAAKLGLPVAFHTGWDPLSPELIHAPSADLAIVARAFPDLTIIAAHMGGMLTDIADKLPLIGLRNVYLDTAMSPLFCPPEECEQLIRQHGVDRVLFGTDLPWGTAAETLAHLDRTALSASEKEMICASNACRLFGIQQPM